MLAHTKLRLILDVQVESNIKLAKARYDGGSIMGAVLSMRRAHRNKNMKAYVSAARFQLSRLQNRVETEMASGLIVLDVAGQRADLQEIVASLHRATRDSGRHLPGDQALLEELQQQM